MLLNWFRNPSKQKFHASLRRRGTATRHKIFRPRLELLEGRITPAVHTWVGAGTTPLWSDAANWSGGAPGGAPSP